MQVPIGRHELNEDQEEAGNELADHIIEVCRNFRWMCNGAGWTDKEFNDIMAKSEKELHTKHGLFFPVYVTQANRA
jgi:hypothetical protein